MNGVLRVARNEWKIDVSDDAIERAKPLLEKAGLIGKARRRTRRPTRKELASLVAYFASQNDHPRTRTPMDVITEFALWSARTPSEICRLRWADVGDDRTCWVRGAHTSRSNTKRDYQFPLLGEAWNIVQRQPRKNKHDPNERIFPYNAHTVSARYTLAKKELGIENLRFQDLRREAAVRLRFAGYTLEQIAEVTGRLSLNALLRDIEDAESTEGHEPPRPKRGDGDTGHGERSSRK